MNTVRRAHPEEITWINAQYQSIEFKPSVYERELIAIAEVEQQKAGLGRLVSINETVAELGGIYVLPDYRGDGIAGKIVEFLLQQSESFEQVFCLPFEHLQSFYSKYGFVTVNNHNHVPTEVLEKYQWCKQIYTQNTLLLSQTR